MISRELARSVRTLIKTTIYQMSLLHQAVYHNQYNKAIISTEHQFLYQGIHLVVKNMTTN